LPQESFSLDWLARALARMCAYTACLCSGNRIPIVPSTTYGLETSFGFDYFHVGAPRGYGIEASWRF